jgi:hypothetical protein
MDEIMGRARSRPPWGVHPTMWQIRSMFDCERNVCGFDFALRSSPPLPPANAAHRARAVNPHFHKQNRPSSPPRLAKAQNSLPLGLIVQRLPPVPGREAFGYDLRSCFCVSYVSYGENKPCDVAPAMGRSPLSEGPFPARHCSSQTLCLAKS